MRKFLKNSILAGVFISLGGMVFLSTDNKYLGAFLFSVGLLSVLIFKADLYTGWVCKPEKYEPKLGLVLIGNGIGAVIMGLCSSAQAAKAVEICTAKAGEPVSEWIIGSVVCGMCIAIAVRASSEQINVPAVILGVMTFILTGSEHVVADIYYFAAAHMISLNIVLRVLICAIGNMAGGMIIAKGIEQKK